MPDLIRHPDVVPTKVGNHLKDRVPVFSGMILIEDAIYEQCPGGFGYLDSG